MIKIGEYIATCGGTRRILEHPAEWYFKDAVEMSDYTWSLLWHGGESDSTLCIAKNCDLSEAMSWVIEGELPNYNLFNTDLQV